MIGSRNVWQADQAAWRPHRRAVEHWLRSHQQVCFEQGGQPLARSSVDLFGDDENSIVVWLVSVSLAISA